MSYYQDIMIWYVSCHGRISWYYDMISILTWQDVNSLSRNWNSTINTCDSSVKKWELCSPCTKGKQLLDNPPLLLYTFLPLFLGSPLLLLLLLLLLLCTFPLLLLCTFQFCKLWNKHPGEFTFTILHNLPDGMICNNQRMNWNWIHICQWIHMLRCWRLLIVCDKWFII